jgi:hypothetical protein
MMKIIPMCNEKRPSLDELLIGVERPLPEPCKGPDCPKFDGGWCPHLLDGGTFEVFSAAQDLR